MPTPAWPCHDLTPPSRPRLTQVSGQAPQVPAGAGDGGGERLPRRAQAVQGHGRRPDRRGVRGGSIRPFAPRRSLLCPCCTRQRGGVPQPPSWVCRGGGCSTCCTRPRSGRPSSTPRAWAGCCARPSHWQVRFSITQSSEPHGEGEEGRQACASPPLLTSCGLVVLLFCLRLEGVVGCASDRQGHRQRHHALQ